MGAEGEGRKGAAGAVSGVVITGATILGLNWGSRLGLAPIGAVGREAGKVRVTWHSAR